MKAAFKHRELDAKARMALDYPKKRVREVRRLGAAPAFELATPVLQLNSVEIADSDFVKESTGLSLELPPAIRTAKYPCHRDDGFLSLAAVVQVAN